jgi:NTE family protein
VRLVLDQLDDSLYPRHGYYVLFEDQTSLLATDRFSEVHAKGLLAMNARRNTLNVALEAGGDFGANDQAQPPGFTLGGFQHLSAYPADPFAGNFVLYGRLTYLTSVVNFDLLPFRDTFLGFSAEAGSIWIKESEFGHEPLRQSYSAFAGMTTGFGPLCLGFGVAPGVFNAYFQLGRPF